MRGSMRPGQETTGDRRRIFVPRIGGIIHRLHVVSGNAARELFQGTPHLRISQQGAPGNLGDLAIAPTPASAQGTVDPTEK